jgi:Mn-dependent DtxR family transcriptional regulator
MISNNEIKMFELLPASISELSKGLNVYPGTASKITEKLIQNGLATKQRRGKNVLITRENTQHAQKLEETIKLFPRLPLEQILTHSNLTLIATLTYPLNMEEIQRIMKVSRQWIHKIMKHLSNYGIITKNNNGYAINPAHQKLQEFATAYCGYINYKHVSTLAPDAVILWQHGHEFLFKTKQSLTSVTTTAVTSFAKYDLPLLSNMKYYYYSQRTLDTADIIFHTILIDPRSKTYNGYACLLIQKLKPSNLVKKARLYNLTDHIKTILFYLNTKKAAESFIPSWDDYKNLANQYGVRYDENI